MSYFRIKSSEAIASVIADAIAKGMDMANLSEREKSLLRSKIDSANPFVGNQSPYIQQAWSDERRKAFTRLGLNTPLTVATGQQSLFDNYGLGK